MDGPVELKKVSGLISQGQPSTEQALEYSSSFQTPAVTGQAICQDSTTKTEQMGASCKDPVIHAVAGFHPGRNKHCRVTAVCLALLCVLLLTGIMVLWINFNNINKENDQLLTIYNTLTVERDQLQTSYNNLVIERDQLQTSYNNLVIERDQLQTSYNNLVIERDQLQTSYNNLVIERDQLQTSYNNLVIERDQLQTSYNNLVIERDQLQTSYNNLVIERNQLQTSYNNLVIERDQLQKLKDDLQTQVTNLDRVINEGWMLYISGMYYISTEKKNWTESRKDCRERGADLLIINTREEQEFIRKRSGQAWIGLNDISVEGDWEWVDNTPVTSGFWWHGEPNNNGDEDCAIGGYGRDPVSNWADYPCSNKFVWICEKMIN